MCALVRQTGSKPWIMLCAGVVMGILVGGLLVYFLEREPRETPVAERTNASRQPAASEKSPSWREMAKSVTMADRRSYALPLNNPDMIPAEQAGFMEDEDVVIGVLFQGTARAYPWWLTSNYHVVNETVGESPLLVTLCEVCGGASAFRPTLLDLPGVPLSFQICGVDHATIEIFDHQTMSRWHPFLGSAFEGPLKGKSLERYPVLLMTWAEWKQLYPRSVVANGSPQLRERPHGAIAGRIGDEDLPRIFAESANLADHRLGLHELVYGIQVPEADKSYVLPLSELVPFPNLFLVTVGTKSVLIARQGELAVAAFDLESTSYRTGFTLVSKAPFQFRSSDGLIWSAAGVITTVDNREMRLPSAKGYLTEWYEWVSHSPDPEIIRSVQIVGESSSPTE